VINSPLRCYVLFLLLVPWLAGCGGPNEGPSPAGEGASAPAASLAGDSADASSGGSAAPSGDRIVITVGGVPVRVRISQTPREKQRGLMFTEQLPADEGMLFVFEYEHRPSFWMKNTPIDLDVAFIDRRGLIVEIRRMQALDEETIHRSRHPSLYALEVNAGWFLEHGVTVGDAVEF
jgi:uncharacterized membrane protein (UPF0127 family)